MARYRIYSETLPYDDVTRAATLSLLRRYGLELVLAVRPWQTSELASRVAPKLRDEGLAWSVWPMIADDEGRWANVHNADRFADFVRRVCDVVDVKDVLLDMEPPFAEARALADARTFRVLRLARAEKGAFAAAEGTFARLCAELRTRGLTTSSAVWPMIALDPPNGRGWQSLLGTPVDALSADHVSVMMYTTILAGWSRGAIRRRDALDLLAAASARVLRRHGAKTAGISLGCVGTGAFEDEPIYASPIDLAEDAAVARAEGIETLALFDLGGVLARPPPEAWLEALIDESTAGATHRPSKRVLAARSLARAATWALRRRHLRS